MRDPTKEEMIECLGPCDELDRERAIYWFANDYHGGQATNLYSVLSTSPYEPGLLESGPGDDCELYERLENMFVGLGP